MRVSLDLHDFSVLSNYLGLLLKLKERYPAFKVSLFTVPFDIKHREGDRKEALERIKKCLDWIQIIPHGLYHNSSEVRKYKYYEFRESIAPTITSYFNKDGLPFVKGFCAPHWHWNSEVVGALDDMGWWGAISPKVPKMECTKRFYRYSHSIDESFLDSGLSILKLHGHLNGTSSDDLEKCFENLLKLSDSVEWSFVTDFIEEKE